MKLHSWIVIAGLAVGSAATSAHAFVPWANSNGSNSFCTSGVSCSASDLRLGLNVNYHFAISPSFDPWVGLGVGYEWLMLSASGGGVSADATASGFEFANVQVGGDIPINSSFVVGPFFAVSIGQYSSISVSENRMSASQDLNPTSIHEWFMFGVRAAFDIWLH